ncbi:MAG: phosphoglycerate dehydrogenase [Clostridia bacterium]|nr:MAG: phosphoglycerate dehydrogenase [Clostridia bacterium]
MRVLVCDPVAQEGIDFLRQQPGLEVEARPKIAAAELAEIIGDYHALVVRSETKVTRELLERAVNLKVIGRAGVGVDNIDVEAATARGIVVVNAPAGNTIAATEHTIGLMLALARNIPQASRSLQDGVWDRQRFIGVELRQKVLGVIGLGKIGSEVARRARAMEMRVLTYDPYVTSERAQHLGVELSELDRVLAEADFITVHLPLTPETRHLIGRDEIARMKKGVRLLNVARGGIIEEQSLYEALVNGHVAGAALDVFEKEPATDNPLVALDQVIATPHLGASTTEAQVGVALEVAREVIHALAGEPVMNAVNIPAVKQELVALLAPYLGLAEKLGQFASQVAPGRTEGLEIAYNGELAQYEVTSLTNTFLKGFLRPILGDEVNYVNAPVVARSRGIKVVERKSTEMLDYANLISVNIVMEQGTREVAGTVVGKGEPRVVRFDGFSVDAALKGLLLVIPHQDQPRIIGPVGNLIGAQDVNIAGMQVGRKEIGGDAVMILAIDARVPKSTLEEIARIEGVRDVMEVEI